MMKNAIALLRQDWGRNRSRSFSPTDVEPHERNLSCRSSIIREAMNIEHVDTNDFASAGSYLDGGADGPFQEEAILILEPSLVRAETKVVQDHFRDKLV
ncbi:hypothetical protein ACJ72_05990 [Emergomyces africanus]|uniref:Uncharacterized protein n=1 Tax=Emergomyces africanus TaxID=1955775 RepID=A0A1B7NSF7_9EURO|nr:hypothetical protein ACJ72_05990 [Emergomyces africanus]